MLSYLTHKLRTPELNGSSAFHTKTDDDHDSGTESDDESAEIEELQKYMEQSIQLEDGSSGHSPSRRRSATAAVLCQHTTSFRQHQLQPEPQQPNNKSADRRRVLPQQQQHQYHHHHHHHHLHTQHHPHHHSELLSGPAVVTALLTATNTAAGHQQQPCCHVVAPSVVVGGSPVLLDSALPSDSDPNLELHSSEEELEVINNRAGSAEKRKWSQANQRRARGARASLRRSRSDGGGDTSSDEEEEYDAASGATLADGVSSRAMTNGACRRHTSDVEDDDDDEDDDEDDEEVRDLTWSGRGVGGGAGGAGGVGEGVVNGVHGSASSAASSARSSSQRSSSSSSTAVVPPTPVEFRASPPLHVHRPYNGSPPPKVFHAAPGVVGGLSSSASSTSLVSSSLSTTSSGATTLTLSASAHIPAFEVCAVSPRKRHRQDRGGGGTAFGVFSLVDGGPVQRPCLDFEKMQQIRVKLL